MWIYVGPLVFEIDPSETTAERQNFFKQWLDIGVAFDINKTPKAIFLHLCKSFGKNSSIVELRLNDHVAFFVDIAKFFVDLN